MDFSDVAMVSVASFTGPFLATVMLNQTRQAREVRRRAELYREILKRRRWFPPAKQQPAPKADK